MYEFINTKNLELVGTKHRLLYDYSTERSAPPHIHKYYRNVSFFPLLPVWT